MSTKDDYVLIEDYDPDAKGGDQNKEYPGWNRLQYLVWTIVLYIVVFTVMFLPIIIDPEDLPDIVTAVLSVGMFISLIAYFLGQAILAVPRFRNQLASSWWALGFFVPIFSFYVGVRALAYPAGYNEHRKLDLSAKLIIGFFLSFIAVIAVGIAYFGLGDFSEEFAKRDGKSAIASRSDKGASTEKFNSRRALKEIEARKLPEKTNETKAKRVNDSAPSHPKFLEGQNEADYLFNELSKNYPFDFSLCTTAEGSASQCEKPESMTWDVNQRINIEVILDVSGSMAGRIDGVRKIDIAKKALAEFVEAVDSRANTALRIYGHKGSNQETDKDVSCRASELIVDFHELGDGSQFLTALKTTKPVGYTPIARSLQRAAIDFAGLNSKDDVNFVYLISDGLETCDGDPVVAAKALTQQIANTVINVIGFDVNNDEQVALRAIANAGQGAFHNASNALELEEVLTQSVNWHEWKRYIACERKVARTHIVDYQRESRRQVNCAINEGTRVEKLFQAEIDLRKSNGDQLAKSAGSKAMLMFYRNRSETLKPFMKQYSDKAEFEKYQEQLKKIRQIELEENK